MKTLINEIKENENVDSFFLVTEKSSGITKTGNPYLKLKLGDRSGEMEGTDLDLCRDLARSFEKDDFVRVKGKAVFFQDRLQINITSYREGWRGGNPSSGLFPQTEKDVDEMFQTLIEISGRGQEPSSLSASAAFSGRTNVFSTDLRRPLPPKQLHQAYLGGLLEHTSLRSPAGAKECQSLRGIEYRPPHHRLNPSRSGQGL